MYRILITDSLSTAGLDLLRETDGLEVVIPEQKSLTVAELRDALQSTDGIIIRSATKLTAEVLDGQSRLKIIVRAGVGVDNIDIPAATRSGIVVMNTPAGNTTSTAEHTIAMMMALSRKIPNAAASTRSGQWDRKSFMGTQLSGKTLAVVGLGRIGMAVAKRAQGLEMQVIGYDPFLAEERAAEEKIELFRNVDDVVDRCDYVTVHTPLTDETRGIINAERIARMKKGVRILNCARGGIVDEAALADALNSGHVAGAALDVFENESPGGSPLMAMENVVATPHLGASTGEAQELVAVEAAELMIGFLKRNDFRQALNLVPISATEMSEATPYLNISYRLGLLLAQLAKPKGIKSAEVDYRGDAAERQTKLMTAAFTAGLLGGGSDENVNLVNAESVAAGIGIRITETKNPNPGAFSSMIEASLYTDDGKELIAAGTMFGRYLRLVRLQRLQLDAFLDGWMLMYKHYDRPGVIGFIGQTLGNHNVNIGDMALGRDKEHPGGESIAVLNIDSEPSQEVLRELERHDSVIAVKLVKLPDANEPLPWFGAP
ncbi:MAG: phosphoglycerate dehydrogenase [Planctomycetota bacterium]|nr:phosphoglycerate dehydrogenase [Planctomycetota bacterium]